MDKEIEKYINIQEYIDVKEKAKTLGCAINDSISILPFNFASASSKADFINESNTITIKKILKKAGIQVSNIQKDNERSPELRQHAFEWTGPLLLFAATAVYQNPNLVSISLNVISNYLTDWFKGVLKEDKTARLSFVVQTKSGKYKKLDYEGPPEGLKELPDIIREVSDE